VTLNDGLEEIGSKAFEYCSELETIALPESVESVGWGAFEGCESLRSVDLGSLTDLGWGAFSDCVSLSEVAVPDTCKKVGKFAFRGCTALRSAKLPAALGELQALVFDRCTLLREMLLGDVGMWSGDIRDAERPKPFLGALHVKRLELIGKVFERIRAECVLPSLSRKAAVESVRFAGRSLGPYQICSPAGSAA
jgi:hypothetical protein